MRLNNLILGNIKRVVVAILVERCSCLLISSGGVLADAVDNDERTRIDRNSKSARSSKCSPNRTLQS